MDTPNNKMDTPIYIDTHAHLYDEAFQPDRTAVIERAVGSGVRQFLLPGIDSSTQADLEALADEYPSHCFPCIGLHPTSVDAHWKQELALVENRIGKRNYHALGEIGLDGYWSKTYLKEQQEIFYRQLYWASETDLPVIIHLREATDALFEVLERFRREGKRLPRGVFHAFSGSFETYQRICSYGNFHFGIGGVCTYKKAAIAQTLTQLPLTALLLETDAPYLTPVPHRGKRNEPMLVQHTAAKIAEIRNMSVEELVEATYQNGKRIYGIK